MSERALVSVVCGGQLFGIEVGHVRDVLVPPRMTRVPLAGADVAGLLNLRGRIVVALDLRTRLGLPPAAPDAPRMSVVVEHQGELYSLLVDGVVEVLRLDGDTIEPNPETLDPAWRGLSVGIYRLDRALLVELDVTCLLDARVEAA
jgi:purine-binding chemotaxis protein CheW